MASDPLSLYGVKNQQYSIMFNSRQWHTGGLSYCDLGRLSLDEAYTYLSMKIQRHYNYVKRNMHLNQIW